MKLVELLARELVKWPGRAKCAAQDGSGYVYFWNSKGIGFIECGWEHKSGCGIVHTDVLPGQLAASIDHATAIVTREMWEAERATLNAGKVITGKPKASKDGWIRHRGGKCPVEAGAKVEVRHRNGVIKNIVDLDIDNVDETWLHVGDKDDIMAYRIHKPAIEPAVVENVQAFNERAEIAEQEKEEMTPCGKLGYKTGDEFIVNESNYFNTGDRIRLIRDDESDCPYFERISDGKMLYESLEIISKLSDPYQPACQGVFLPGKIDQIDGPIQWRDRIREIDTIVEALEEERVSLIQRLEDEGFKLIAVKIAPKEPDEDMSDWRNWRVGDLIERIADDSKYYTQGETYQVERTGNTGIWIEDDEDGNHHWTTDIAIARNFKFHSRP